MSAYEDEDFDDGRFEDSDYEEREDDFDIPTYDELDIEGRYYTYGSREEYNAWRAEEIRAMIEAEERSQEDWRQRVARKNTLPKTPKKSTLKAAQKPAVTAANSRIYATEPAPQIPENAYEPQPNLTPQTFLLWCAFFAIVFLFVFYCIIA